MIFWAFLIYFLSYLIYVGRICYNNCLYAQYIEHYLAFFSLPSTLDEILVAVSRLLGSA